MTRSSNHAVLMVAIILLEACKPASSDSSVSASANGSSPTLPTPPSANAVASPPAAAAPAQPNPPPGATAPGVEVLAVPTAPIATLGTTVAAPSGLTYAATSLIYTLGAAISDNRPTSTGGTVASFSILPALPAGLSLNENTGVINGTPKAVSSTVNYTVTATNAGGTTTTSLSIAINPPPPNHFAYSSTSASYTLFVAIPANLPNSGDGPTASYSVLPALPVGLTLDPTTGVISGIPTALSSDTIYIVTATNAGGTTTTSLNLTVNTPKAPSGLSYSTPVIVTYTKGFIIIPNSPTNTGGIVTSYAVSPALPAGLVLDGATGVISGTPSVVAAAAIYSITATNLGGATTTSLSIAVTSPSPTGTISTIAGDASQDYSGYVADSIMSATGTSLDGPVGVAVDDSGRLYIADFYNLRIRVVVKGAIWTIAGNGKYVLGDGGPATSASISGAEGVALDRSGNIYIIDFNNIRIRKVAAANNIISTVAGNGTAGFSGDNGPATSASFYRSFGIALDSSSNIYFSDTGNQRIRMVRADGTISTVAGNGTRGYSGDGGPATSASLNDPTGVAIDASGSLYIADSANGRIRKVSTNGTISTVTGNGTAGYSGDGGPATIASLNYPYGVAVDATGSLYIADSSNNRIRKVSIDGTISTVAGSGPQGRGPPSIPGSRCPANGATDVIGPATNQTLCGPQGVTVDSSGSLYIADTGANRIRKVTPAGPSGMAYATPATYTLGLAITANAPTSTGGSVAIYSVAPALPAGLALNKVTGVIAGTPTGVSAATSYNITATNAGGTTNANLVITINSPTSN